MKINTKVSHHDLVQKYKSLVDGEEILKPGFKISNKKLNSYISTTGNAPPKYFSE